jgi:hypothetical protein
LPLPVKFYRGHQKKKFGHQKRQNLTTNDKIGPSSRKREGAKVRHGITNKSLPPMQFGTKTQN